jgi:hypothetical protein
MFKILKNYSHTDSCHLTEMSWIYFRTIKDSSFIKLKGQPAHNMASTNFMPTERSRYLHSSNE